MNGSLSITNLEAERQRRQVEQLAQSILAGRLPDVRLETRRTNPEGGYTNITLGALKLGEVLTEIGRDPDTKKLAIRIANGDVEESILRIFSNPVVAQKLFDHVFDQWKQVLEVRNGKDNVILYRYGNTRLSAGSANDPYPEL